MEVLGAGTYAFIVGQPWSDVVYKIYTDKTEYTKEVENARLLEQIDPAQQFFVYGRIPGEMSPLQNGTTIDARLLSLFTNYGPKPLGLEKNFSLKPNATMYVLEMHRCIPITDTLISQLTLDVAVKCIENLISGLKTLHNHGYIHGDAHEHNVVFSFKDGRVTARWIDFGKMHSKNADYTSADATPMFGAAIAIFGKVDIKSYRDALSRQSKPNSIIVLQYTTIPQALKLAAGEMMTKKRKLSLSPSSSSSAETTVTPSPSPKSARRTLFASPPGSARRNLLAEF